MGDPYFKIKNHCISSGIRVYSSNYALYGDMSGRVNDIYRRFSPKIEVYSIDESFLDLTDVHPSRRVVLAKDMRSTVRKWTGIPTCVGIGPTKTLAKLANHIAKVTPELGGVCDLSDENDRAAWLGRTPLKEIWGVGPATARKLEAFGCRNVGDVRDLDPRRVRNGMTVVGERLVYELRGIPCLDLDSVAPTRKGCAVTRSFSSRLSDLPSMEQAVSTHAARLGEKLRREGLGTDHVTVFFHTSEHDRDRPQRSVSTVVTLPESSNDTLVLSKAALSGVRRVWREGFAYSKAGIITTDLMPLEASQRALIGGLDRERSGPLMDALDACNRRYGRGSVVIASAGLVKDRSWSTKFEMRSPRYTTRIGELPVIRAA